MIIDNYEIAYTAFWKNNFVYSKEVQKKLLRMHDKLIQT